MEKMSHWGTPIALSALVLTGMGSLQPPATAVTPTTTAEIAQATEPTTTQPTGGGLVGQCRTAKQRIFIYTQRSTNSQTIRTLAPGERVTLADNGSGGWIAISTPETGYVQTRDLAACSGGPIADKPKPDSGSGSTGSLCRIVTYRGTEGLVIRRSPDKTSTRVGGVDFGDRVTLRTSPLSYKLDNEKRAWVELTAPVAGWVSYGFPSTKSTNLGLCR